jgi:hypothetical protein
LKINDSEFLKAEQILMVYLDRMILAASMYSRAMGVVREAAINDGAGNIASVCEYKSAQMNQIVLPLLTHARSALSGRADPFISRIDDLDRFLFGRT